MAPHIWLVFLMICSTQSRKTEAAIAPCDNCQRKCGKLEIPYPFGTDKGCYIDEAFKVTCNKTTGSLIWSNGTVDISISTHSLQYKKSMVVALKFDKSGETQYGHTLMIGDLHNNFYISHTRNKFVAMGCDFYAYIIDRQTKNFVGGCAPFCNRTDILPSPSSSCSGLQCCQINLPKDPTDLYLWFETMNTMTKSWAYHCGFFAIVDKDFALNKSMFSDCNQRYHVPLMYEWAVGNTSCSKATGRVDYACGQNTECIDYKPGMSYRCKCSKGYRGNPYLLQGCQDIDECGEAKYKNTCPKNDLCVNTAGGYYCSPYHRRNRFPVLIALGIGLAVGILVLVAISLWIWRKIQKINDRTTKQRCFKRNGGLLLQQQISSSNSTKGGVLPELKLFRIEELEKATDKFSEIRILGKGGLGTVYKGMLSDGKIVAVKKANISDDSQVSQFINEVFILSQINHRHIVKLLGCCLETQVPLLVYEYISNGTLSQHIHDEQNTSTVSWENRLRIAAEVAGALAYLHSYASTAIYHRDIKSSNILLDENYKAVISDFGLSRSVSIDRTHLTTLVGGTFGYLDPEYFRCGQLNDKSDVYAFGVVLAEILTGQKAISSTKDDVGLALRFRSAVKKNCLSEILEQVVADEGDEEEILAVAKLAKRCMKVNARKRPSMKEVAAEIDQLRKAKELPGHQDSFRDDSRSISESCQSSENDSEAEDDQTMSKTN
ncbi:hypothetical protein ABFS82_08G125400 [Erythranthe guttata]|uniref:wall-associated receptor kinase 5-like n=1 Tax=Erythranthe guttata TaxID=4155 RepID=UPI00064D9E79|nr:PREDICTED: wall-associated receptor kinase 5-like [Erythranthe guttata]|eukprot:XP_012830196.1 PREDICTED: wall-associated receptor kinase 5-like [Erythranthe guttata]